MDPEHKNFLELPPLTPDELGRAETAFQRECQGRYLVEGVLTQLVRTQDLSGAESRVPLQYLVGVARDLVKTFQTSGDAKVANFFDKLLQGCTAELLRRASPESHVRSGDYIP